MYQALGTALNTTCSVPVLKGFLSSGRRLSVMHVLRAENSYLWRIYRRNMAYFRSQKKSALFFFFKYHV